MIQNNCLASLACCKQLNLTILTAQTEKGKMSEISCDYNLGWNHGVITQNSFTGSIYLFIFPPSCGFWQKIVSFFFF